MPEIKQRCAWVTDDPLYIDYHDNEWGRAVHDDRRLFEMIILEGAQAGLNWFTVLKKRAHYRMVTDQFDPYKIAAYDVAKMQALLQDPGIIRNRKKVNAMVNNAKAYCRLVKTQGSFSDFVWQFVDHQPIVNQWDSAAQVPVMTDASRAMSSALRKQGFQFVGPTICYAYMQAVGMVVDHTRACFLSV